MRPVFSDLAKGTSLAAIAAGLSSLLALVGLGRSYYLAIFLPVSMLLCLLLAWLLYLRDDRFLGSPAALRDERAAHRPADQGEPPSPDATGPQQLLKLAARWDEEPLLRQALVVPEPATAQAGTSYAGARRSLLWAAAELGLAASLLYALWGIGKSYGP